VAELAEVVRIQARPDYNQSNGKGNTEVIRGDRRDVARGILSHRTEAREIMPALLSGPQKPALSLKETSRRPMEPDRKILVYHEVKY
jgi:hypothetical protein